MAHAERELSVDSSTSSSDTVVVYALINKEHLDYNYRIYINVLIR